jgi:hypothetical protein
LKKTKQGKPKPRPGRKNALKENAYAKKQKLKRQKIHKVQDEADTKRRKAEELAKKENFERSEKARLEAEEAQRKIDLLKQEKKDIKQESKEVEVEAKEVVTKVPKIDGLSFRTYWKFEIVDLSKLPREFLKPDEVAIGSYVTQQKELGEIPGVRRYSEKKSVG